MSKYVNDFHSRYETYFVTTVHTVQYTHYILHIPINGMLLEICIRMKIVVQLLFLLAFDT